MFQSCCCYIKWGDVSETDTIDDWLPRYAELCFFLAEQSKIKTRISKSFIFMSSLPSWLTRFKLEISCFVPVLKICTCEISVFSCFIVIHFPFSTVRSGYYVKSFGLSYLGSIDLSSVEEWKLHTPCSEASIYVTILKLLVFENRG